MHGWVRLCARRRDRLRRPVDRRLDGDTSRRAVGRPSEDAFRLRFRGPRAPDPCPMAVDARRENLEGREGLSPQVQRNRRQGFAAGRNAVDRDYLRQCGAAILRGRYPPQNCSPVDHLVPLLPPPRAWLILGDSPAGGSPWHGDIHALSMFRQALSQSKLGSGENGAVLRYRFSERSGTTCLRID